MCLLLLSLKICRCNADEEVLAFFTTGGTLIGGWLGAVVVPLDWDRPWQVCAIYFSGGLHLLSFDLKFLPSRTGHYRACMELLLDISSEI